MNIRLVRILGLTLPILLAAGCDKPQPRALFTVNYYRTHESIRHDKIRECQSNTELSNTPDCINATKAESQGTLRP
jgi:hypothetical protein